MALLKGSDGTYVLGLQPLGTLLHLELHLRAFIQRTVAVRLNSRKMHEHVIAGGAFDKSKSPRGGTEDLLFTTDMLLEDVHFRRATHSAEDAGHKALARGLSDIAAMGGTPRFCLLSMAVPRWADPLWVDDFYRGFLRLANQTGSPPAGGGPPLPAP